MLNDGVSYWCPSAMVTDEGQNTGLWWEHTDTRTGVLGEELVPVTLGPPLVPRGLAWDRSLALAVMLVIQFPIGQWKEWSTACVCGNCRALLQL